MDSFVRTAIVAVAGAVALGAGGVAVASPGGGSDTKDPIVKREDTATTWVQSIDLDDDPGDDDDDPVRDDSVDQSDDSSDSADEDSPTHQTAKTGLTKNTAPTGDSTVTKNTSPTSNTGAKSAEEKAAKKAAHEAAKVEHKAAKETRKAAKPRPHKSKASKGNKHGHK